MSPLKGEGILHYAGLASIVLGGVLTAIGWSAGGETFLVGTGLIGLGILIWVFKWFFVDPYGRKGRS